MRFDVGTTDVPTAGTQVQLNNSTERVQSIAVKARSGNVGNMYFGVSDVASANGWELLPGEGHAIDFGKGSEPFSSFWVDAATNGDDLDWAVVLSD